MKRLCSVITVGCLVSTLILSSTSHAFVMEDSGQAINVISRVKSVSSERVVPAKSEADTSAVKDPQIQVMSLSDGSTTENPEDLAAYLGEDPTLPQESITLRSETNAVIDGYQLNHDQVKVLNINTGNITINTDTYSQLNGDAETPWDARSDAYVIRGIGNSVNNITVNSPQIKVTIYLMDLEWNGTITSSQNTELELVICGKVVTHTNLITSAQTDKLTIKGLTTNGNSIRTDGYIFNSCAVTNILLENVTMSAKEMGNVGSEEHVVYSSYCNNLLIDHANVTNMAIRRSASIIGPSIVIKNNSEVKNLYTYEDSTDFTNTIQVLDSKVDNYRNYFRNLGRPWNIALLNVYKMIAANSVLNINTSAITTLEADKCTMEVQGNLAFSNLIANLCSIKGDFVGTPVDYNAADLYLKIFRLRDHPNEYVSVSIDGGEKVKLLTDLNGSIFPYVKAGTTTITVTTADGTNYNASFDAVKADDETVIILTPGGNSGGGTGGGEGGGTVDTEAPEITDTALHDVYLNAGDALSLAITAKSMTAPSSLSYQWYKDGVAINTSKGQKRTYSVTSSKAENAGVYYCEVTDNNNNKMAKSKEVYVSVYASADPKAPIIMGQSSSMTLVAGSSVTLSVNARPSDTRSSLTFQWYKGTSALAGKTSRTLSLANVKASDAGSYYCVVTDDLFGTTAKTSETVINIK